MFSLFLRNLSRWFRYSKPFREAYLASAVDLGQLEERMRILARSQDA